MWQVIWRNSINGALMYRTYVDYYSAIRWAEYHRNSNRVVVSVELLR